MKNRVIQMKLTIKNYELFFECTFSYQTVIHISLIEVATLQVVGRHC